MSITFKGPGVEKLSGSKRQPRFRSNPNVMVVQKRRKVPTNRTLNQKIKKIQSREELKHRDTLISQTVDGTGSTLALLNGVPQSAGAETDITRVGNDITATSIQWRLRYNNVAAQLGSVTMRMLVFWDQQPNGAAPTAATLLDGTTVTSLTLAPYHRDYQKRYKILHDSVVTITPQAVQAFTPATGATTALVPQIVYRHAKRQLARTVKYIGNGATVASIGTNSLYAMWISNVAADLPTVTAGFRLYFKDD